MRVYKTDNKISVFAIAGTHVVLMGFNVSSNAREGLLGFVIEKKIGRGAYKPLRGGTRAFANYDAEELPSSRAVPIQSMMWGDYTVDSGKEYSYRVTPVNGLPENQTDGQSLELSIKTEKVDDKTHGVFFNRGVAGSQSYSRLFSDYKKYYPSEVGFGDQRRTVKKAYIKPGDVPDRKAYKWLSRGLEEGMLGFIAQAKGEGWSIRAAVYEFSWQPALQAFVDALDRGADVKVIHHAKYENKYLLEYDRKTKPVTTSHWADGSHLDSVFKNRYGLKKPQLQNEAKAAISGMNQLGVCNPDRFEAFDDMLIQRTNTVLSHNKFIVLLKDGKPKQVWTGSTNFTDGGIFGQSNVGHIVRDETVAANYLEYWEELAQDPKSKKMKEFTSSLQPDLVGVAPKGITTIFSPRSSGKMLSWYANRIKAAQSSVFFTAAFSMPDEVMEVVRRPTRVNGDQPFLRYLLLEGKGGLLKDKVPVMQRCKQNKVAWGDVLKARPGLDEEHLQLETLSGLNSHVNFIHTKYMLVDPLSDDPLVVSGSANFSDASTTKNDENMLVIRGNTRVADIFLGEFMRLFNHFHSRNERNALSDEVFEERSYLTPDDSWMAPYFEIGTQEWNERCLFAGPGRDL